MQTQVQLAGSSGLIRLSNVGVHPSAIYKNTEVALSGDLNFLGLPWYGLMWIIAIVKYPQAWWEFFGASEVRQQGISTLGGFEIIFDPFEKEGEYSVEVLAYLGPTTTSEGVLGGRGAVIFPPFPAVASFKTKFTVLAQGEPGTEPGDPDVEDAFNIGQLRDIPITTFPGAEVILEVPITSNLKISDKVTVSFEVHEHGTFGVGDLIDTLRTEALPITPNQTLKASVKWKAGGAFGGKDIIAIATPSTSAGTSKFTYISAIDLKQPSAETQVFLGQLKISPATVYPGDNVSITLPVTMKGGITQNLDVLIEVHEHSLIGTGDMLDPYMVNGLSFTPGQSRDVTVTWKARGATGEKDVYVEVFLGGKSVAKNNYRSQPIVKELPPANVSISLGEAYVTDRSNNNRIRQGYAGQQVTLHVPIVYTGPQSLSVQLFLDWLYRVVYYGVESTAGNLIFQFVESAVLQSGRSYEMTADTVLTQEPDPGRNIGIRVEWSGGKKENVTRGVLEVTGTAPQPPPPTPEPAPSTISFSVSLSNLTEPTLDWRVEHFNESGQMDAVSDFYSPGYTIPVSGVPVRGKVGIVLRNPDGSWRPTWYSSRRDFEDGQEYLFLADFRALYRADQAPAPAETKISFDVTLTNVTEPTRDWRVEHFNPDGQMDWASEFYSPDTEIAVRNVSEYGNIGIVLRDLSANWRPTWYSPKQYFVDGKNYLFLADIKLLY